MLYTDDEIVATLVKDENNLKGHDTIKSKFLASSKIVSGNDSEVLADDIHCMAASVKFAAGNHEIKFRLTSILSHALANFNM